MGQTEGWGCRQKKMCGQQTQCDSLWLWAIPAGGLHTDPCLRHTWADLARCPLPGRAGRGQLQLPAAPWQPGWSKTQVPLALRRDRLEEGRERFLLSPNRPLPCFISASDPHSGRNPLCPACPTTGVTPEVYRDCDLGERMDISGQIISVPGPAGRNDQQVASSPSMPTVQDSPPQLLPWPQPHPTSQGSLQEDE